MYIGNNEVMKILLIKFGRSCVPASAGNVGECKALQRGKERFSIGAEVKGRYRLISQNLSNKITLQATSCTNTDTPAIFKATIILLSLHYKYPYNLLWRQ